MTDYGSGSEAGKARRKKVVLADASRPVTVLRTIVELEEQSSIGTALVRHLIKAQLQVAIWLAVLALGILGAIPLAAFLSPRFAAASVFGVPLTWLLLGVLPFPFLFAIGYAFNRLSERYEREFVIMARR
ncbi:MAG: hypothetical protein ACRDRL_12800 [Sciscionella sp.]